MRWWSHVALGFVMLLWSTRLGDEEPLPQPDPSVTPTQPEPKKKLVNGGGRMQRQAFAPDRALPFDRAGFLKAFTRQAERELYTCLRAFKSSPGSLGLTATFVKATAQLSEVRSIQGEIPACVGAAIREMRFPTQAVKLRQDAITVQWRVDW